MAIYDLKQEEIKDREMKDGVKIRINQVRVRQVKGTLPW